MKRRSFREQVALVLPDAGRVELLLSGLTAREWLPVAEVFASALPECDALFAAPGAELLSSQVAEIRGLPVLNAQTWSELIGEHEGVIISVHLQDGKVEQELLEGTRQAGWRVLVVAAAIERTNLGARREFADLGVRVQAAVQLADTPAGLIFERRAPDRWAVPERSV